MTLFSHRLKKIAYVAIFFCLFAKFSLPLQRILKNCNYTYTI